MAKIIRNPPPSSINLSVSVVGLNSHLKAGHVLSISSAD